MDVKTINNFLITFGEQVLVALIILVVGFRLIKAMTNYFEKALDKKDVDPSLKPFLSSVVGWFLKAAVFIAAANTVGIKTTSFIAILGTVGLAVGLSLQGSLSNFAGGVLILLLKPFKVGDAIKAQGFTGKVEKITAFSTFLKTPDNQVICLPNGSLANAPIVNINQESTRRVDLTFGIGYEDDIATAKKTLSDLFAADIRVLKDPELVIVVGELADSSVNLYVRAWVKSEDYWGVYFDSLEKVKNAFDEKSISIPFPQTDIHVHPTAFQ